MSLGYESGDKRISAIHFSDAKRMKRELFDIWEDQSLSSGSYHWRMQLVNYVGSFPSREKAESFAYMTKKFQAATQKSVVKKSK